MRISDWSSDVCSSDLSWYAIKAAEAVKCQWAKGNYPADQADHWALLEASFVPEKLDKVWRNDGDVDTAMRGRELIEAEYRAPYVAHQPLEPISAIALVRDDSAEVWTCTMFHAKMAGMV